MSETADQIDLSYGNPMAVISSCLRSFICAAPGNELLVADYSNIEGRGLAWLAGDSAKVDKFVQFDFGRAPDIYIQTYADAFGVPMFDKKDPRRQTGKTMELFSGYQGSHGAYLKGIAAKDLPSLAAAVRDATHTGQWREAAAGYNGSHGLTQHEWTAIKVLVTKWRKAHPAIVDYWTALEAAAILAVEVPGKITSAGHVNRQVKYLKKGSFLFCQLPSKRRLAYPFPKVVDNEVPWGGTRPQLRYMSVDSLTKRWVETQTYGGKLCENVTQAVCRDILADAMTRLEAGGFPVVMHVHDEIVCELPQGAGDLDKMESIMCKPPGWAEGFPIATEGYVARRYRK